MSPRLGLYYTDPAQRIVSAVQGLEVLYDDLYDVDEHLSKVCTTATVDDDCSVGHTKQTGLPRYSGGSTPAVRNGTFAART